MCFLLKDGRDLKRAWRLCAIQSHSLLWAFSTPCESSELFLRRALRLRFSPSDLNWDWDRTQTTWWNNYPPPSAWQRTCMGREKYPTVQYSNNKITLHMRPTVHNLLNTYWLKGRSCQICRPCDPLTIEVRTRFACTPFKPHNVIPQSGSRLEGAISAKDQEVFDEILLNGRN